eukprot:g3951.t1
MRRQRRWKEECARLDSEFVELIDSAAAAKVITFEEKREALRAEFNEKLRLQSLERWKTVKVRRKRRAFAERTRRKMEEQREEVRMEELKWRGNITEMDRRLAAQRKRAMEEKNARSEANEKQMRLDERQEELDWVNAHIARYWKKEREEDEAYALKRKIKEEKHRAKQKVEDNLPTLSETLLTNCITADEFFGNMNNVIKTAKRLRRVDAEKNYLDYSGIRENASELDSYTEESSSSQESSDDNESSSSSVSDGEEMRENALKRTSRERINPDTRHFFSREKKIPNSRGSVRQQGYGLHISREIMKRATTAPPASEHKRGLTLPRVRSSRSRVLTTPVSGFERLQHHHKKLLSSSPYHLFHRKNK